MVGKRESNGNGSAAGASHENEARATCRNEQEQCIWIHSGACGGGCGVVLGGRVLEVEVKVGRLGPGHYWRDVRAIGWRPLGGARVRSVAE